MSHKPLLTHARTRTCLHCIPLYHSPTHTHPLILLFVLLGAAAVSLEIMLRIYGGNNDIQEAYLAAACDVAWRVASQPPEHSVANDSFGSRASAEWYRDLFTRE